MGKSRARRWRLEVRGTFFLGQAGVKEGIAESSRISPLDFIFASSRLAGTYSSVSSCFSLSFLSFAFSRSVPSFLGTGASPPDSVPASLDLEEAPFADFLLVLRLRLAAGEAGVDEAPSSFSSAALARRRAIRWRRAETVTPVELV